LRLQKGGNSARILLEQSIVRGCRPQTLLTFQENKHLELLVLPTAVFDPLWLTFDKHDNYDAAHFLGFDDFFRPFDDQFLRPNLRSHNEFFPGAFAYHWHNRWNAPESDDSFYGILNDLFGQAFAISR
jgi:hypothetical protein